MPVTNQNEVAKAKIELPAVGSGTEGHRKRTLERNGHGTGIPLGRLLADSARLRRYAFDVMSAPSDLTRAQYSVLAYLERTNNQGPNQTEMAKALELGKVTLGVTLERLEDKKFVKRRPAPYDGRLKTVFITPAGREALKEVGSVPCRVDALMMRGIDPLEQRLLMHALTVIRDNLLSLHKDQALLAMMEEEADARRAA